MAAEKAKVETIAPAAQQLVYKECMRNHGLGLGRYTVDGCGEFLQLNDDAFHCAACGCHRSFHRKEPPSPHQIPPIPSPASPPPSNKEESSLKKKRNRLTPEQRKKMVRFATEKLSWRPHKQNVEETEKFCGEVGISRRAFMVWVYNNKPKLFAGKMDA